MISSVKSKVLAGLLLLIAYVTGLLVGTNSGYKQGESEGLDKGCKLVFAQFVPVPIGCKVIDGKVHAVGPNGQMIRLEW